MQVLKPDWKNWRKVKMDRQDHLLIILAEECAEVQQAATKALRFGLDDFYKILPTNRQKISQELGDLFGVYEMLISEGILERPLEFSISQKKEKVEEFLLYSKIRKRIND